MSPLSMLHRRADVGGDVSRPENAPHVHNTLYKYYIACPVLSYIIVGTTVLARIYTKAYIKPGFEIEDYTCILAWVFCSILSSLMLATKHGAGLHVGDVPPNDVISFLRLQYVGGVIYFPAASLTKASIVFLIARVFRPHHKAVLLARILIGLMVLYYVPMFFIRLLNCIPIQKSWQRDISGRCLTKEYNLLLADGIINLAIDLNILLLPVPLVLALQISRKKKMQILMIFASGIAAFSAIVAFVVEVNTLDLEDLTFSGTILSLLVLGEVSLGIICSSLPVLPAFYKHVFKSARKAISTSSTYHELEVVGRSRTGVERVRSDYEEQGHPQRQAASEPALHRQYLAPKRLGQEGPSFTVSGGTTEYYASSERLWTGEGILKTVKFERVEETSSVSDPDRSSPSRPPNAVLQSERCKGMQ